MIHAVSLIASRMQSLDHFQQIWDLRFEICLRSRLIPALAVCVLEDMHNIAGDISRPWAETSAEKNAGFPHNLSSALTQWETDTGSPLMFYSNNLTVNADSSEISLNTQISLSSSLPSVVVVLFGGTRGDWSALIWDSSFNQFVIA